MKAGWRRSAVATAACLALLGTPALAEQLEDDGHPGHLPVAQAEKKSESATAAFFFEQGEKFAEAKAWSSARFWYEKAAKLGHAKAQFLLGVLLLQGLGGESSLEDFGKAGEWWKKSAAQGFAPAQSSLGALYVMGQGVPQDYGEAVEWLKKAEAQGFAPAQVALGELYEEGLGVRPSRQEARELYRRACDGGDQDGCVALKRLDVSEASKGSDGRDASSGRLDAPEGSSGSVGWRKDRSLGAIAGRVAGKALFTALLLLLGITLALAGRLALKKLLKAPAERQCGKTAPAGAGRPKTASEERSPDSADFSFGPAHGANDGPASAEDFYRLGCMVADGAGGAPEAEARAMEFFRKAAAKGHAEAQARLGCMLLAQWKCAEARAWFWKAAEQGVPQAQAELGFLLLYGSGGDRNDSMAARALSAAAAQDEPRAMSVLSLMAEHGLGMPENEAEAERWQECARASGGRTAMDAFRKETEGMLRNWGVIGLEPRKRFKRFLSTLDTPARRIGFLALLLGIALTISGLAGIATDSRHPGTGVRILLGGGSVLAGAGALGMTGMLDRLWSWILHGSKGR